MGVEGLHAVLCAGLQVALDHIRLAVADTGANGVCGGHDLEGGDATVNLAIGVELRQEYLGDHGLKSGGELCPDLGLLVGREGVDDTVDGLCGAGGVEGTEDEVAGFCGCHGGTDGLDIAHFADEDHIGVLTEGAADGLGEARHVVADLTLGYERLGRLVVEFDRIFNRDDVHAALVVDDVEHRGEGSGLTGSGWAGHEDESARLEEKLLDDGRQAELLHRKQGRRNLAEDHAVALALLEDGDTETRGEALLVFGLLLLGRAEVAEGDGVVGAAVLLYLGHVIVGRNLAAEVVAVLFGEILIGKRQKLAVYAKLRRHVGADVEVAAAFVDHGGEQVFHRNVHCRTPLLSCRASVGVAHGYAENLGERGHAVGDLEHSILTQGAHTHLAGTLPKEGGRRMVEDEALDGVIDLEDLEDALSSLVAALSAAVAARAVVHLVRQGRRELAEHLQLAVGRRIGLAALLADRTDETLGHGRTKGRGDEERLDADIEKTGDGRGGVVGVEGREHEVASERGLHGDVGCLGVTNLADHDDVRRLTQDRAEGGGEVEADILVDLHLVDTAHLVFDRVFDGDELLVGRVDLAEAGVESSGLAGAGRAGHEHDAVRQLDEALEGSLVVGEEAELRQAEREVRLVEHTHDDRFAMVRRHGRDTKVEVLAVDVDLDTPILRDALLGDLHLRHDLDTRDDRALKTLGGRIHLSEGAVDSVANAELLLHRLEMNIGSLHLDAVDDKHRGELYDRGVIARGVGVEIGELVAGLDVGGILAALVELGHRGHNLALRRDDSLHVAPMQNIPERVDGVIAHRIGKRDSYGVVVGHDRHDAVLLGDLGRNLLDDLRIDGLRVDVAVLEAELIGHSAKNLVLANRTARNEHVERSLVFGLH